MNEQDEGFGEARPSKSAKKREIEALQVLAAQMAALSDKELKRLEVAGPLRDALALVRPMQASGARNRQIKHCVKFMQETDLSQVTAYLEDRNSRQVAANQVFHAIELWRDRLIEDGDKALEALFERYPQLDRQHLRQLSRDAVREQATGKPPGAARKLFRHLRESLVEKA